MCKFTLTRHVQDQAREKGIELSKILDALQHGYQTPVTAYPHQTRYIKHGIAVVADDWTHNVITVYLDRVITPLRPDQIARGERINRTH